MMRMITIMKDAAYIDARRVRQLCAAMAGLLLTASSSLLPVASIRAAEPPANPRLGILVGERTTPRGEHLADLLYPAFSRIGTVDLMERRDIERILDERELNRLFSGVATPGDWPATGRMLSADYILLLRSETNETMRLRLLETKTGVRVFDTLLPASSAAAFVERAAGYTARKLQALRHTPRATLLAVQGLQSEEVGNESLELADELTEGLERHLALLPGVVLLERRELGEMLDERLRDPALPDALSTSGLLVSGHMRVLREPTSTRIRVILTVSRNRVELARETFTVPADAPVELYSAASGCVRKLVDGAASGVPMDAVAESAVFAEQGECYALRGDSERAVRSMRAARSLNPAEEGYWRKEIVFRRDAILRGDIADGAFLHSREGLRCVEAVLLRSGGGTRQDTQTLNEVISFLSVVAFRFDRVLAAHRSDPAWGEEFAAFARNCMRVVRAAEPILTGPKTPWFTVFDWCATVRGLADLIPGFDERLRYIGHLHDQSLALSLKMLREAPTERVRPMVTLFSPIRFDSGFGPDGAGEHANPSAVAAYKRFLEGRTAADSAVTRLFAHSALAQLGAREKNMSVTAVLGHVTRCFALRDSLTPGELRLVRGLDEEPFSSLFGIVSHYAVERVEEGREPIRALMDKYPRVKRLVDEETAYYWATAPKPAGAATNAPPKPDCEVHELIAAKSLAFGRLVVEPGVAAVICTGGTSNSGTIALLRFDPGAPSASTRQDCPTPRPLPAVPTLCHAVDGDTVYVGVKGLGIVRFPVNGPAEWLDEKDGLPSNEVLSLAVLDGILYVVAEAHARTIFAAYDRRMRAFDTILSPFVADKHPLADASIQSIVADPKRQCVWATLPRGEWGLCSYFPRERAFVFKPLLRGTRNPSEPHSYSLESPCRGLRLWGDRLTIVNGPVVSALYLDTMELDVWRTDGTKLGGRDVDEVPAALWTYDDKTMAAYRAADFYLRMDPSRVYLLEDGLLDSAGNGLQHVVVGQTMPVDLLRALPGDPYLNGRQLRDAAATPDGTYVLTADRLYLLPALKLNARRAGRGPPVSLRNSDGSLPAVFPLSMAIAIESPASSTGSVATAARTAPAKPPDRLVEDATRLRFASEYAAAAAARQAGGEQAARWREFCRRWDYVPRTTNVPPLRYENGEVCEAHGPTRSVSCGDTAIDMIWLPPGEFAMGCDTGRTEERPRHRVRLTNGFWMGKYEITQRQWTTLMGRNPSYFLSSPPDAPVDSVTWNDATAFCARLCEREHLPPGSFRLPTEEEWEYAARAGSATTYYRGDEADRLRDYAWFVDNSGGRPRSVGLKKPNRFGLYDMTGNVAEWCMNEPYAYALNGDPAATGWRAPGGHRSYRGCGYRTLAWGCRLSFRLSSLADFASADRGFRILAVPFNPGDVARSGPPDSRGARQREAAR